MELSQSNGSFFMKRKEKKKKTSLLSQVFLKFYLFSK